MHTPQLRGITLYWRSDRIDGKQKITANKLQLDSAKQRLYIFPQSQSQVVISVSTPEVVYQQLNLANPQLAATVRDKNGIILLRDEAQKLEIKVTLNKEKLNQLISLLQTTDN